MATTKEDLKDALKEALEQKGVLTKMRAEMREEIFKSLQAKAGHAGGVKPILSNENLLINELIHEYLKYNGYNFTADVLLTESGQKRDRLDRRIIENDLRLAVDPASASHPLLYLIIDALMRRHKVS